MKTYIMQLEKYDDIVSVRDKMRWGKAGRILLVWPDRGEILNRRLDLVLLKRHSASLGAQLAIVSRDPDIRYHAPRLGIPVFKNLKKAQSSAWRVPRRFRSASEGAEDEQINKLGKRTEAERLKLLSERPVRTKKPHPIIRAVAFTVGVLAFLSIAAVLLPSAESRKRADIAG